MSTVPTIPARRPPAMQRPAQGQQQQAASPPLQLEDIPDAPGLRVVIYGPGGIGKTSLAACAPGPVAFFDLDESLGVLKPQLSADVQGQIKRVPVHSFLDMRNALASNIFNNVRSIVVDSATKAEELAAAYTFQTCPHPDNGRAIKRVEDYGYGKGFTYVYETFIYLLNDLDNHARAGRNVVLVCHDCVTPVPNPAGEDWQRWEPRLQSPSSGKASIRHRVREWADHVLFIGYDIDVKDGKAKGSGTRTIYPVEMPFCMAKSRTLDQAFVYGRNDAELWRRLGAR